jgi:hypothetical protein
MAELFKDEVVGSVAHAASIMAGADAEERSMLIRLLVITKEMFLPSTSLAGGD